MHLFHALFVGLWHILKLAKYASSLVLFTKDCLIVCSSLQLPASFRTFSVYVENDTGNLIGNVSRIALGRMGN